MRVLPPGLWSAPYPESTTGPPDAHPATMAARTTAWSNPPIRMARILRRLSQASKSPGFASANLRLFSSPGARHAIRPRRLRPYRRKRHGATARESRVPRLDVGHLGEREPAREGVGVVARAGQRTHGGGKLVHVRERAQGLRVHAHRGDARG